MGRFSSESLEYVKKLGGAFARYFVAGGTGFLIDYMALTLCYEVVGMHYLLSSAIGFILGLVFVYIVSNKWVFDVRRMKSTVCLEFFIFALIGGIGLGLTLGFMWFFVELCHIYPLISKIITTVLVLLWNFSARKIILYS